MLHLLILLAAASALGCDLNDVQNLAATYARSSEIRVGWLAPNATYLACVRGYRICSTPNNVSVGCTDVQDANISEYSLAGLQGCTQFNISVMALGDNNTMSAPVSVTASTAPGPVSGLGVTRRNNDTITALWNYVFTAGTTCAAQFQLSLCDVREANCTSTDVAVSGSYYTLDLPHPRSCNAYVLNLAVLDASQQRSDNFRFAGAPDIMGIPENLTVYNYTSSSFDLEWEIPAAQVNCDYRVRTDIRSRVGVTSYGYTTLYDGGRTNHLQTNVTSCTAFNVSVSFGTTENENSASTTAYTLPEGDEVFENATVLVETSSSLRVAWNSSLPVDQCIAAYSVCWGKQNSTSVECRNATNEENSLQIAGLAANTKYQISVSALLHTGVGFGNVSLDASTMSGAAGLLRSSLVGFSTIFCLLRLSI